MLPATPVTVLAECCAEVPALAPRQRVRNRGLGDHGRLCGVDGESQGCIGHLRGARSDRLDLDRVRSVGKRCGRGGCVDAVKDRSGAVGRAVYVEVDTGRSGHHPESAESGPGVSGDVVSAGEAGVSVVTVMSGMV